MLKKLLSLNLFVIFITLTLIGCSGARTPGQSVASTSVAPAGEIAVLSLRGNTDNMTADQIVELKRVGTWMDRDIIKQLNRAGYNAKLLSSRSEYNGSSHLLIIDVDKFKAGNRAARAFVGFGAGGSSLNLDYQLLDGHGKVTAQWKDGVGSSKGGTYCAKKLNRNAIQQLKTRLSHQ